MGDIIPHLFSVSEKSSLVMKKILQMIDSTSVKIFCINWED